MPAFLDVVHRATVTGLLGAGIWGIWLTAAVWKSRRDDHSIDRFLGKAERKTQQAHQSEILTSTSEKSFDDPAPAAPQLRTPSRGFAGPRGILQEASRPRQREGAQPVGGEVESTLS